MGYRFLRIFAAGLCVAALLIRFNPMSDPQGGSTWMYLLAASWEYSWALGELIALGKLLPALRVLALLVSFGALPVLGALSLLQGVLPSRPGSAAYRITLVITVPATCYRVVLTDPHLRGPGFWAGAGVVVFAAVVEVLVALSRQFKKPRHGEGGQGG